MPKSVEVVIARQRWRLSRYDDGPRWLSIRVERVGKDYRPFRCGDDGKPAKTRVGRSKLVLRRRHRDGRIMFDADSSFFDRDHRKRIGEVAAALLHP